MNKIALAIHGGAGTILRSSMTAELELEYRGGLENALRAGWEILKKGGSSMDAVESSVVELENFPLFNAGRGSVFTHDGKQEMDAAIMDGKSLNAGAVAFVKNIKNPIRLARMVLEKTEHVLLAGDGANQFAEQMGVETAPDEYFFTQHRYDQLVQAIETGSVQLDHSLSEPPNSPPFKGGVAEGRGGAGGLTQSLRDDPSDLVLSKKDLTTKNHETAQKEIPHSAIRIPHSKGTVGAVACDSQGNLAAATSTGGMTNKQFGRIGDTPIIGAGTYADNKTCAVSCTGHGEFFMIGVTAYDVAARMKYKGLSLEKAAIEAVNYLTEIGGEGGLIAVDALGNVTLPFNSEGMYRGFIGVSDEPVIDIYK